MTRPLLPYRPAADAMPDPGSTSPATAPPEDASSASGTPDTAPKTSAKAPAKAASRPANSPANDKRGDYRWKLCAFVLLVGAGWLATQPLLWSQWVGQDACSASPCHIYWEPFKTRALTAVVIVAVVMLVASRKLRWWAPMLAGLWSARSAADLTGIPTGSAGLPGHRDGIWPALNEFVTANTMSLEPGVSVTSGVHWSTVIALAVLSWAAVIASLAAAWDLRCQQRARHNTPAVTDTVRRIAANSPLSRWVASDDNEDDKGSKTPS